MNTSMKSVQVCLACCVLNDAKNCLLLPGCGWKTFFFLSFYILFSIFNHIALFDFLGGSPSCLLLWQASLESMEDLCFVTFVQKNDGLSDGEHGQPSGISGGAFL